MKKFLFQAIGLLVLLLLALVFFKTGGDFSLPFLSRPVETKNATVGSAVFKVEIADTEEKRIKGLGGRSGLEENGGMLFIFDSAGIRKFWMKGLNFPLDFIWIREDKVVDVTENVPAPTKGQKDLDLPVYQSKEAVDEVLEVNAGSVKKFNIKAGDPVVVQ